jgi:hypothetical protein
VILRLTKILVRQLVTPSVEIVDEDEEEDVVSDADEASAEMYDEEREEPVTREGSAVIKQS